MKSLALSLVALALLAQPAAGAPVAGADPAAVMATAGPTDAVQTTVIVIGPFPLEVYDAVVVTEPLEVTLNARTYFNLGFFEVDTATDTMWPWGLGLVPEAQVALRPR